MNSDTHSNGAKISIFSNGVSVHHTPSMKKNFRRTTQQAVYNKMNTIQVSEYLKNARTKLTCDLDAAFRLKLSTSLIIIDPTGNGRRLLIDEVLHTYNSTYSCYHSHTVAKMVKGAKSSSTEGGQYKRNYVGVVNSDLLEADWEALVDLAGQFMIRSDNREARSHTKALEDLEFHFRQCRSDGLPAVVVLEGFHRFASKRQTLIYTLLDLMHKKDLLFIMIGITGRADVQYILEKRVLSRLNAQFVYLDAPTAEDIAKELYNKCILPLESVVEPADSLEEGSTEESELDFRIRFNKEVIALFGEYSDSTRFVSLCPPETEQEEEVAPEITHESVVSVVQANDEDEEVVLSQGDLLIVEEEDEEPAAASVVDLLDDAASAQVTSPTGSGVGLFNSPPVSSSRRSLHRRNTEFETSPDGKESLKYTQDEHEEEAEEVNGIEEEDEVEIVELPPVTPIKTRHQMKLSQESIDSGTPRDRRLSQRNSAVKQRFVPPPPPSSVKKKPKIVPVMEVQEAKKIWVPSDTMNFSEFINNQMKNQSAAAVASSSSSSSSSSSTIKVESSLVSKVSFVRPGSFLRTIQIYKEWGYNIDDFIRTVQFSIMGLTDQAPFLTRELLFESMAQQMPCTVAESMSSLDEIELYLLAAMCYLHLHQTTADHFTVAALVTNYDRMTSNLRSKRIQKLHLMNAINSLCNKKFIQLFNNHSGVKSAAETGVGSITNQTIVFLSISAQEIKKAFLNKHLKPNASGAAQSVECRRAQPLIQIQERIRKLLENPMVNNLYSAESSSVLQTVGSFL